MFDKDIIQTKGFANTRDGERVTGFQVRVRTPYYRGMWASLIEGADVTVDGEHFGREQVVWTLGDRTYTVAELARVGDDVRWPYEEVATLSVEKSGGLEPGLHELEIAISYRMSYIPIEMQPTTYRARRKVTLVR